MPFDREKFVSTATRYVRVAGGWYWSELTQLFPWIKLFLRGNKERAVLQCGDGQTSVIFYDQNGSQYDVQRVECSFLMLEREKTDPWIGRLSGAHVALCVEPQSVYRFPLTIPSVARQKIRDVVKYSLLAEAPIDPSLLEFDVSATPSAERNCLDLDIALCRKSVVEAYMVQASLLGIPDFDLGYLCSDRGMVKFLFQRSARSDAIQKTRRIQLCLAAAPLVAIVLATTFVWLYASMKASGIEKQIATTANAGTSAKFLLDRKLRDDGLREGLESVLHKPSICDALNSISEVLPRNAWISEFRKSGEKVELTGFSKDPTAVVKGLSASPQLKAVRLDSTRTDALPDGLEKFNISADLATGGRK